VRVLDVESDCACAYDLCNRFYEVGGDVVEDFRFVASDVEECGGADRVWGVGAERSEGAVRVEEQRVRLRQCL